MRNEHDPTGDVIEALEVRDMKNIPCEPSHGLSAISG